VRVLHKKLINLCLFTEYNGVLLIISPTAPAAALVVSKKQPNWSGKKYFRLFDLDRKAVKNLSNTSAQDGAIFVDKFAPFNASGETQ